MEFKDNTLKEMYEKYGKYPPDPELFKTIHSKNITVADWNDLVTILGNVDPALKRLYEFIPTLDTSLEQVRTNTAAIEQHDTDITNIQTAVAENAADISDSRNAIEQNAEHIATNTAAINNKVSKINATKRSLYATDGTSIPISTYPFAAVYENEIPVYKRIGDGVCLLVDTPTGDVTVDNAKAAVNKSYLESNFVKIKNGIVTIPNKLVVEGNVELAGQASFVDVDTVVADGVLYVLNSDKLLSDYSGTDNWDNAGTVVMLRHDPEHQDGNAFGIVYNKEHGVVFGNGVLHDTDDQADRFAGKFVPIAELSVKPLVSKLSELFKEGNLLAMGSDGKVFDSGISANLIGDIDAVFDELHSFAQTLIDGGETE